MYSVYYRLRLAATLASTARVGNAFVKLTDPAARSSGRQPRRWRRRLDFRHGNVVRGPRVLRATRYVTERRREQIRADRRGRV